MLRLIVVLLLVANLGYYAWSAGWLQGLGMAPANPGEPARLQQQVAPQALRLPGEGEDVAAEPEAQGPMPGAASPEEVATPPEDQNPAAQEAPPAPAAAPAEAAPDAPEQPQASQTQAPTPVSAPVPAPAVVAQPTASAAVATEPRRAGVCLQAGVFDARQAEALRTALASWPRGSWTLDATPVPGRWMIYMGRYADEEATARKRAELRALGVTYDRPGAAYEPGLALGRFSSEEGAQRGLALLGRQGVRSARIVQVRAEAAGHTLRLPALDGALLARVPALRPALGGKELRSCR